MAAVSISTAHEISTCFGTGAGESSMAFILPVFSFLAGKGCAKKTQMGYTLA